MNLVVYYSLKGHVKKAAEDYAAKNGCELAEIVSLAKYGEKSVYFIGGMQATFKLCPKIRFKADLSKYDKVIVCSPVWASTIAAPVRTFLKKYGKNIKKVGYILMHADKEQTYEKVMDEMDAILGKKRVEDHSLVMGETVR